MFRPNSRFEILTPDGFKPFDGVNATTKTNQAHVVFSDGSFLKCSNDHPIKTNSGFFRADELVPGTRIPSTGSVELEVVSVTQSQSTAYLYDPINVGTKSEYYSGTVISHNCEFLGSSNTLISGKKLRSMAWSKPRKLEDYERAGKYAMYADPVCEIKQNGRMVQAGRTYLISVDCSRGQGLDYHAFQVIDITEIPYKVVASYRNNTLSHLVFPTAVVSAARYWNDAFILVEISDNGQQIADIIHYDLEYDNLVKIQTRGKKGQEIVDSGAPTKTSLGLKTSVLTKKIGCANLKAMIEADKILVEDDDTIMEFFTFISVKNSYEADAGKNDDMVMCLVNASWLLRQDFFRDMTSGDLRAQLVKEQAFDEELLMPMPILGEEKNERFIDSGLLWERAEIPEFSLGAGTSTYNDYENVRRGY